MIVTKTKLELRIDLRDAPSVSNGSLVITGLRRISVVEYDDRARVSCVGYNSFGDTRTITFNLYGYPQHQPPPNWIKNLIKETTNYWGQNWLPLQEA